MEMTEKRFLIIGDSNIEFLMQTQLLLPIYDNKERLNLKTCCDLLNELHDENEQLKQQLASINRLIDNKIDDFKNGDYGDLPCNTIHMFLDLKQEIGDYE